MSTTNKPYPDFHVITKPLGPICNLDCHYCFYLEKENLYPNTSKWTMSPEVLEEFIAQYIAAQQGDRSPSPGKEASPRWWASISSNESSPGKPSTPAANAIDNSLQTNAVLIDDRWAEFLARISFWWAFRSMVPTTCTIAIASTKGAAVRSTTPSAAYSVCKAMKWNSTRSRW